MKENQLRSIIKNMVEESSKKLNDNVKGYKHILEPYHGQKVYMENIYGEMVEVTITSGQYWSNGRVSNHWHWEYENGEEDYGYGCFYIKQ